MEKKTANEEKIISALLECRNLSEVSERTKTPPRTLYTLLQNTDFKQKLNTAKSNALNQAVIKLNHYTSMATDILADIAQDVEQNAQVRVSACRSLLDAATRFNEQIDVLQRLTDLERLQAENSRN